MQPRPHKHFKDFYFNFRTTTMPITPPDLWLREAALVARQFVMMLNGSMLYGCGHPNTVKSAVAFAETLTGAFHGRDMITIIANNGAIMIEEWPLDKSFNVGKLLAHFEKLELKSISFLRGVDADSVIRLVGLIGDTHSVDVCKAGLVDAMAGAIPGVRVNYVIYGKMTADDVVVNSANLGINAGTDAGANAGTEFGADFGLSSGAEKSSGLASLPPSPDGGSSVNAGTLSQGAVAQIEQVLTLSSLLEKPREVSAVLAQTDTSMFQIEQLHSAFGKIKGEIGATPAHSVDELLESLHGLKKDLYEAIEIQKTTGRMMRSAAIINKELNDLTSIAVIKLVKEEYKSGKTPLNRLAHAIRRMLPSNAELMHLLPGLKEMLLAEGMSLGGYLELVRMLGLRVESEALTDSLKEAADAMGASVSDLVTAIQSKPEEAARLILLASEIRRGTGEGTSNLPEVLTSYIEEVCSKMAVDACGSESHQDSGTLKKILAQLESQVFNQLAHQGVPTPVMHDVRQLLSERFKDAYAAANEKFMEGRKAQGHGRGGDGAGKVADKGRGKKMNMPTESLSAHNLFFLINKEIKRSLRYKTPFATVTVTIEKIVQTNGVRPPKPEDLAELLPQLFVHVEALLRDVDLIGTVGAEQSPELFILLPMTGEEGTAIVKERIVKKATENAFAVAGQKVGIAVKVSSAAPNGSTKDLKTYMALARTNHKREK
jgi:hypothetical protein